MNTRNLCVCLMLFVLTTVVHAKDAQEIINGCWNEGAHPAMSACVVRHSDVARRHLEDAEFSLLKSISAYQETDDSIVGAKNAFDASVVSFRAYRNKECGLRAFIKRMSNAADAVKTACEAELDERRANVLDADKSLLE